MAEDNKIRQAIQEARDAKAEEAAKAKSENTGMALNKGAAVDTTGADAEAKADHAASRAAQEQADLAREADKVGMEAKNEALKEGRSFAQQEADRVARTEDAALRQTVLTDDVPSVPSGRLGTYILPDSSREVGPVRYFKSSIPTFNFDASFSQGPKQPMKSYGRHQFVGGWFVTNSQPIAYYLEENFIDRSGITIRVAEGSAQEYQQARTIGSTGTGIVQPVIEPLPGQQRSPLAGGFTTGPTNSLGTSRTVR